MIDYMPLIIIAIGVVGVVVMIIGFEIDSYLIERSGDKKRKQYRDSAWDRELGATYVPEYKRNGYYD